MSNERNESFIFYASFDEALSELDDEQYGKMMRAINKYAIYGTEPELTGILKAMFILIKPQLDANMRRRTKGNTGGRPTIDDDTRNAIVDDLLAGETQQRIAEKYKVSQGTVSNIKNLISKISLSKTQVNDNNNYQKPQNNYQKPNVNENANDNVNDNDNENEKERGGQAPAEAMPTGTQTQTQTPAPSQTSQPSPPQKKQTRFVKPTVEEVAAFCKQRGNTVDAEAFVNFYESKGWYIGKNKMQNWHAAVYTWEKRERQEQERTRASPRNKTHSADYDFNTAGDVGEPLF